MYLVPVLVAVDAPSALSARLNAESEFRDRALHIGIPRRLTPSAVASAEFDLRVTAKGIERDPAHD